MDKYWAKRQAKIHQKLYNKTVREIQTQLEKYYLQSMNSVIDEFEAVYDKLQSTIEDGKEITPADLYKLDKYWKMQNQLKQEMQKLGNKQIEVLSKEFEKEWKEVYESISLPSDIAFSTISKANAQAMINTVWLADGKIFSQRVWNNVEYLVETLNEKMIECVVTGKKTTDLRKLLQERFDVSRNQANTLIRTEAAHIKTEAAKQRYEDYGLTKYEFLADTDDRTCKNHSSSCESLDGKKFYYSEMQPGKNAPPMHPNCRCAIIPVID